MTSRLPLVVVSMALLFVALAPRTALAAEKSEFEVTVFTEDKAMGAKVLAALRELGYTNPENEVLGEPNEDFNIKWGAAPQEFVDEIAGAAERLTGKTLARKKIFEEGDKDIFVNLPLTAEAPAKPAGADPQFDADGIPQACGMPEGKETYGSIRMGTRVILGRHRPFDGDENWAKEMDEFVGATAAVTSQDGVDAKGCPVVHVDTDKGKWAWRIRDLRLAK